MTLTSSGPKCDVCGGFIILDKSINPFSVSGIGQTLHCHDRCKLEVMKAYLKSDWKILPEGPLKKAFQDHEEILSKNLKEAGIERGE